MMIALLSISVFSTTLKPYSKEGFSDNTYSNIAPQVQNTLFNDNFNSQITYSSSILSNQMQPPINFDYDNDGINELLVASNNVLRIYRGTSLLLNQTIDFTDNILHYAMFQHNSINYLVVETESGGLKTPKIFTYSVSGNTFTPEQAMTTPNTGLGSNFDCRASTGNCIEAVISASDIWVYNFTVDGAFSPTQPITPQFDINFGGVNIAIPYPFTLADTSYNGVDMFIFAAFSGNDNILRIMTALYNASISSKIQSLTTDTIGYSDINRMNSPIFGQFNGNSFYTIAGGFQSTNLKPYIYSAYFNNGHWIAYQRHTSIFAPQTYVISNMMQCKIFSSNTGTSNYCMIAYTSTNATILLGSNDFGGGVGESNTILAVTDNNTGAYVPDDTSESKIAHALNANNNIQGNAYISDFLTPFGIYKITEPNYFTGLATFQKSYVLPTSYAYDVISPINSKESFFYDIAAISSSNIFYISDNFIIPSPTITQYTTNPCVNSVWNLTTQVQIGETITSYSNFFQVSGRAILYYQDSNAQDSNWTAFYDSGAVLTFNFIANKTIQNGKLLIMARDSRNTSITTQEIPFSVGIDGKAFDSCQTTGSGVAQGTQNQTQNRTLFNGQPITNINNPLAQGFRDLSDTVSLPPTIFLLLILFFLDLILFVMSMVYETIRRHFVPVIVGIGTLDLFAIILSTLMGLISSALVISISALLLIIGAIFLAARINKSSAGGT